MLSLGNKKQTIELLKPEQVSKALGVTNSTVYKWVDRKLLPYYRIERCIRFKIEDVQDFLARRRIEHDR